MIYHITNRRGLLEFLTDRPSNDSFALYTASSSEKLSEALSASRDADAVMLVWKSEEDFNSLFDTFVIVVPDQNYQEIIAWAITYIGDYRPLTSFFHVFPFSAIERFDIFEAISAWLPRKILDSFVAAVIAEAAIQTDWRSSHRMPSIQSCTLTFSFAATKGLYQGLHPSQLVDIAERWDAFRSNKTNPSRLSADQAISFWLVATSAFLPGTENSPSNDWIGTISSLVRAASADNYALYSDVFLQHSKIQMAVNRFFESTHLPRERLIRVLDDCVRDIVSTDAPPPLKEATIGLLIAKLGDGSLSYLGLALDTAGDLICSPLWFAFFCGFQKGFDGLSGNNSLGRHLVRKSAIKRDIFNKSQTHLSYDEAQILAANRGGEVLFSGFGSVLDVELVPGVTVPMPNPFRRAEEEKRITPPDQARAIRMIREGLFLLERPERNGAPSRQDTARVRESGELFSDPEKPDIDNEPKRTGRRKRNT